MNVLRGKESRRRMVSELDQFTTHLVTAPPIPSSIPTDSLAEETNGLGLFMACIFPSRVAFPAIAALRIRHDFARQPAGSGIRAATRPASGKKVPLTVWSTEAKAKWMAVRSGSSCPELCRSAAENADPGPLDQGNRNRFPERPYFATAMHDVMRLTVPIPK